jgi:hypothetical protein
VVSNRRASITSLLSVTGASTSLHPRSARIRSVSGVDNNAIAPISRSVRMVSASALAAMPVITRNRVASIETASTSTIATPTLFIRSEIIFAVGSSAKFVLSGKLGPTWTDVAPSIGGVYNTGTSPRTRVWTETIL